MFKNRENSQKPSPSLLADFKTAFPGLTSAGRSASTTTAFSDPIAAQPIVRSASLSDAVDVSVPSSRLQGAVDDHDIKDLDPTPRANLEHFRFTPSIMDPNSFAFSNFANQPPGYYTPTPGGTNTIYHSQQAGDLHVQPNEINTPSNLVSFHMGLGTPLSMPTSEGEIAPPGSIATGGMQVFQNPDPFGPYQAHQHHQQQSFAPHQFTRSEFNPMQSQFQGSKMVDVEMAEQPPHSAPPVSGTFGGAPMLAIPQHNSQQIVPLIDNFRFHTTLNAPTAMVKTPDEIPTTYLNKGQAYSLTIVDTAPLELGNVVPTYRTYVRVSFEDEEQRKRAMQCWLLWKEGRGTTEAQQRGGRLLAVEFVDPAPPNGMDERPQLEMESASFDGFAVKWSPVANGQFECTLAVRFNFLSTDFSHSKGVKGIPVRLCAKTSLIGQSVFEICYCKVQLFRDHGAERKLANDIAHVKKSIEKLKLQISQLDSGKPEPASKKKKSDIVMKAAPTASVPSKPGKVPKHKRTWSMSSASDLSSKDPHQEEDLTAKLGQLQDMFTSTRPSSILFLRGEDADDPDAFPILLPNMQPQSQPLRRVDTGESMWDGNQSSTQTSSSITVSPTPSQRSVQSQGDGSAFARPTPFQPATIGSSSEWSGLGGQSATGDLHPEKIRKVSRSSPAATAAEWIEALGIDNGYQPPAERVVKPVACIYFQPRISGQSPKDSYYRAVYLMRRTVQDLINGIATKSNIEPSKVIRALRVTPRGINVLIDDEVVVELREGQDMVAEFQRVKSGVPLQRSWESGPTDIQVDGELESAHTVQSEGYELRLIF